MAACTVNLIIWLFISSRNNVIEEAEYWLRWKYLIWAFIVVAWLYLWLCSNYHHPHVGYWWWWQRAALCNGFTSWGNSCENWWWSLNTQLCGTVGAEEVYYKVWRYLVLLCIRVVVMWASSDPVLFMICLNVWYHVICSAAKEVKIKEKEALKEKLKICSSDFLMGLIFFRRGFFCFHLGW